LNKHMSKHLQDAFFAYCRSTYSQKFHLRNEETMKFAVRKLSEEELEEAWQDFVRDMKDFLTK